MAADPRCAAGALVAACVLTAACSISETEPCDDLTHPEAAALCRACEGPAGLDAQCLDAVAVPAEHVSCADGEVDASWLWLLEHGGGCVAVGAAPAAGDCRGEHGLQKASGGSIQHEDATRACWGATRARAGARRARPGE